MNLHRCTVIYTHTHKIAQTSTHRMLLISNGTNWKKSNAKPHTNSNPSIWNAATADDIIHNTHCHNTISIYYCKET